MVALALPSRGASLWPVLAVSPERACADRADRLHADLLPGRCIVRWQERPRRSRYRRGWGRSVECAADAEGRANYSKEFAPALCSACVDQVKAAHLRAGKPRNIRTLGALFSGTPYRQIVEV